MWPRRPSVAHCRALGVALAELHVAGADFGLSRENTLSVEGWRKLWDGCRDRADEVEPGLRAELSRELEDISANWPQGLPAGIIHADLFPDNVFFIGDRLSGLIDFYFACRDFLAYDIATCINAWCFEKDLSFNLTKATALLAGYRSVRPLEQAELAALPVLARGSALRFALTRLYDWLNGPDGALVQKRDPMDYVRRLRFHRGVTSASAYGLERMDA
jgi:homoserine kinase type II